MPLNLPEGTQCFVDSNILYYALVPTGTLSIECTQFLRRAVSGEIKITAIVSVLSDAIHKVMISEVAQLTGRDRAGLVGYIGKHPEIIGQLVEYPKAMQQLSVVPIEILPVDVQLLSVASVVAVRERLMTNDALIVAMMQRHGLTNLATNDDDFDQVKGLTIWKPR